jgi:hypothetical protein
MRTKNYKIKIKETNISFFIIIINVGVQTSLRTPPLISRALKLMIM